MSGICGLFNLDNAPVADGDLHSMTAMLERRGPEGSNRCQEGPIGLGHTLLATTPELQFERQPFKHPETNCVITADVRLDNRDALLDSFGLIEQRDSTGDAELILLAYLKWGEACVEQLLGDFAFAIWDPRVQKLFCARDHFGMRPFYYHHAPGKLFLFASDARAILVLPQVPYRINDGRIADFLVPQLEWIDYTSTFFDEVYRLPPGHKVTITPTGLDVVEYWQPQPGPELGPMSDDDYAQGFLEVFTRAVEARLRAPSGTVGSMLSGGMDSGSVVAVGKEILSAHGDGPLPTFSAIRRRDNGDADCAESRAIYASVSTPLISATLIHPDALEALDRPLFAGTEEPFDDECMMLKAVYQAARDQGIRVVLDGGGGDIVLSEGSYITRLIHKGHIKLALAEIAAESKFWEESLLPGLRRHARAALVPETVKKRLRGVWDHHNINGYIRSSLICRDFAASVDIRSRFEQMRQTFGSGWTSDYAIERCNTIRPNVTGGRERYARIAAATGTEARDPFLDKRVVDYCTRLPGRFRLQDGWPKMMLRELMADKLPDEVLWCRGKPHLGSLFNAAVTNHALHHGEPDFAGLSDSLSDYVDSAALARARRSLQRSGEPEQIHSAYVLSKWLQESANRPVVPE